MIKCCIFDLDGTLLDTLPTIQYYMNVTLERHGIAPTSLDDCRRYIGDGARLLVTRALTERGITDKELTERVLNEYKSAYDAEPLHLTKAYEGIHELLTLLSEQGITLAVLSNKPDTAARGVVEHFFPGVFHAVRGGTDGVPLKPIPTAALSICNELGISPSECAFIGDTAVDIVTAENMGAGLSVGVLWGFRDREELERAGARVIVASPLDILREVTAD